MSLIGRAALNVSRKVVCLCLLLTFLISDTLLNYFGICALHLRVSQIEFSPDQDHRALGAELTHFTMPLSTRICQRVLVYKTEADYDDVCFVVTNRSHPLKILMARCVKDIYNYLPTAKASNALVSLKNGRGLFIWKLFGAVSYHEASFANGTVTDDDHFEVFKIADFCAERWQFVFFGRHSGYDRCCTFVEVSGY
jgi:hypothetical protein